MDRQLNFVGAERPQSKRCVAGGVESSKSWTDKSRSKRAVLGLLVSVMGQRGLYESHKKSVVYVSMDA
jgi:hypothetical protein